MSKHILDRKRPESGARAENFARIERHSAPAGSHPAAQALHRRSQPEGAPTESRTGQFFRIERGLRA